MKKLLPQLAFLLLLLLPLLGRAQEIPVGGRVIDGETKKPVPFASVSLLKEDAAVLSSDSGYFNLSGLTKLEQDSLIVMHVGYLRYARAVTPRINELPPIELCQIKTESNKKVSNKRRVSIPNTCLTLKEQDAIKISEYAALFKPKNPNSHGAITTLHYYIRATNSATVALNIYFYRIDATKHIPIDELLSIQAIAKGLNEDNWYSLDLRKHKVVMPSEGCYVSVKVSCLEGEHPVLDAFVSYIAPTGELILPLHDGKRYTGQSRALGEKWKRTEYREGIKVEIDTEE